MRSFVFGQGQQIFGNDEPGEEDSIFDRMIKASGGESLPGALGLTQALLSVWTKPIGKSNPYLFYSKNALSTAAILRRYHKNQINKNKSRVNEVEDYLTRNKLEIPNGFRRLTHVIHAYSDAVPYEEFTVGPMGNQYIKCFTLPNGTKYSYVLYTATGSVPNGQYFAGRGPFVKVGEEESFLKGISNEIWKAEDNSDLQLSARKVQWGGSDFTLSNIGDPDDYVSAGAEVTWQNVEMLGERCKAFQAKNMSRKIIFYGAPGTGKTQLSRNLARYIGGGYTLRIEASAVESAGTGAVTEFINLLRPRVILFDDLDRCDESAVELLHYMEQASDPKASKYSSWTNGIIVIGTVNTLKSIDPALLRPGRFDEVVRIDEPCDAHRKEICKHYLEKHDVNLKAEYVSKLTAGFAPADIRELIQCAATVGVAHFKAEVERIRLQRGLYAGDACQEFITRTRFSSDKSIAKIEPAPPSQCASPNSY